MRVLVAEDDRHVSSFIRRGLEQEGFTVDVSRNGRDAYQQASQTQYDLIVLDVLMPSLNGFQILTRLRKQKRELPILILSARCELDDRVWALNNGADDYLAKPFAFEELTARIHALLRRPKSLQSASLRVADLVIDVETRHVSRSGKRIKLTPKEFALLEYLVSHKGHVVTRTMIAERVWNQHFDSFSNVIDVYVRYLRKKVDDGFSLKLVHTVRGVGYVVAEQAP